MQEQLQRIFNAPTATVPRMDRAYMTFERYRNTIQRNLGYRNTGTGIGVLNIANMRFTNPNYQSIREINNTRVSTRSYMGMNNG